MVQGESIIEGIVASGGERLDKALAMASGLSRERVKALLETALRRLQAYDSVPYEMTNSGNNVGRRADG